LVGDPKKMQLSSINFGIDGALIDSEPVHKLAKRALECFGTSLMIEVGATETYIAGAEFSKPTAIIERSDSWQGSPREPLGAKLVVRRVLAHVAAARLVLAAGKLILVTGRRCSIQDLR
jgi:hypothetical protein